MTTSLDRHRASPNHGLDSTISLYINLKARECSRPHHRTKLHSVTIKSFASVKDLKDTLQGLTSIPVSRQRLFYRGSELPNGRMLHDVGITSNCTVNLVVTSLATGRSWFLGAHGSLLPRRSLQHLIDLTHGGMECGLAPILTLEGTQGVYFLRDRRKRIVAVYKPRDEEAFMQNNPRGLMSYGNDNVSLRPGIRPGEAYLREVAAYLLDHGHKLGVPATTIVESRHPSYSWGMQPSAGGEGQERGKDNQMKVGSFQEFVHYDEIVSDIAPEKFEKVQVQLLAVLDIRILNCDRHDANILLKRKKIGFELIPIDHGMSFPEVLEIASCDWCWISWRQIKEPIDPYVHTYILALNPEKDAEMLREKLNLRPSCCRLFRVVCTLLIEGAKAGLTLYEIANIILRQGDLHTPSIIEHIMFRAQGLSLAVEAETRVLWSPKDSNHFQLDPKDQKIVLRKKSAFNFLNPEDYSDDGVEYDCSIDGKESANSSEVGFWEESMSAVDKRNSTRVWDELDVQEIDSMASQPSSPHVVGGEGALSSCHHLPFSLPELTVKSSSLDASDAQLAHPKQNSEGLTIVEMPPPIAVAEEQSLQQCQGLDLDNDEVLEHIIANSISDDSPAAKILTPPSTMTRSNSFAGFGSFPLSSTSEIQSNTNGEGEDFESHFLYFVTHLVKEKINAISSM